MPARTVLQVLDSIQAIEGEGFLVHRPFPRVGLDQLDPFLLLDEMGPRDFGPGEAKGTGDHPHRGFDTVTYMLDGALEHRDSLGHVGLIGPGEVQWMTAGAGIVHRERPSDGLLQAGGRLHGVQLWVNLPARAKMTPPLYRDLTAERIPVVIRPGATIRVVAGEVDGRGGDVDPITPITYVHASVEPGARVELPAPAGHTAIAYLVGGSARFGPDAVVARHTQLVHFAPSDEAAEVVISVDAEASGPAEVLVLTGQPLGEPVARHGPFVMNDRAELVQAFEDYEAGRLGAIPARSV